MRHLLGVDRSCMFDEGQVELRMRLARVARVFEKPCLSEA